MELSARPALAWQPTTQWCSAPGDGDSKATVPWLLFPGYHDTHPPLASTRNLPGACLGTRCPSPYEGGGENLGCSHSAGHPPSNHGNPAIGTGTSPPELHSPGTQRALGTRPQTQSPPLRNGDEVTVVTPSQTLASSGCALLAFQPLCCLSPS